MASVEQGLKRDLSLLDSLMINIGTILASAIFIVPAVILRQAETPFLASLVWVGAGFLSWCGAVTFAELAVLYPRAGGQYVYLERTYHRFWGYLYGWTLFSVIQSATIAAVAVAFMTYLGYFVPLSSLLIKAGAMALILALSVWNCVSLRASAETQNWTTLLKLLLVGVIVLVCFAYGGEGAEALRRLLPTRFSAGTWAGLGAAMMAALWAYDGWISVTFVGGEVRNPGRLLPRSLTLSVAALVVIYLMINTAYLAALPAADMAVSERVAADAVERVLGRYGGGLASLAVVVSCFAALNGFIFTGARVYYAMARDGVFFPWAAKLTPQSRVPAMALLAQGVWSSGLTLTGTYDQLFTYVIFDSWLFYALGAAGIFVLRRREPDRPRPYRAWGYPVLPAVFVLLAGVLLLQTLVHNPRDSWIGIGILLSGIPAYLYWTRSK